MLDISTMHAGTDSFHFRKRALFRSRNCFDLTYDTSCAGFIISGTEPEGTNRRIIFEIDGKLYKFGNAGALTDYENRGELDDILDNGNTVGELLALENANDFVGKKVFPIVALDAPSNSPVFPKINLKLKVNSYNDIYVKYIYSPIYLLTNNSRIFQIVESKFTNGNGNALVQCQLDGAGDWIYTADAANKKARQIQFRTQFIVSTLDGSDSAKVNYVKCFYSTDADKLSGANIEIISLPQEYPLELKTFRALIKHSELIDAEIKAFVNLTNTFYRENIMIGSGGGTFYLSFEGVVDKNISADSIKLQCGGKPITDFYFDTENSSVTFQAPNEGEVLASYECTSAESWSEMTLETSNDDSTLFSFTAATPAKIAAVKFVVTRFSGVSDSLQIDAGKVAIPHKVKTLSCSSSYKYDAPILTVLSPANLSYEYEGELPAIEKYIWGAAVD